MKEKVLRFDDFGRGICYIDNKVTFVPFCVPGDIIEVEKTLEKKAFNEARIVNIIESSQDRVTPMCPYFETCGGCQYQMISYEKSLETKYNNVVNYFRKNNLDIRPILIKCDSPFNYRNKIILKVVNSKIGYYKNNSHDIVEIDKCLIAGNKINDVIKYISKVNIINGEVIIRANYKGDVLIIINTLDNIDISYLKEIPNLIGVVLNDKTIFGVNYFKEEINGLTYNVAYDAFFQVNRYVCSKMFNLIENFVCASDYVLDLYSGVGTLGLTAAKKAKKVLGVEINKNAVDNANSNALLNNLNNANFIYSDAGDIESIDFAFNKLIVDPPRNGLSKGTIDFINVKLPDEIMYISCDYHTQVRDLKLLNNYEIINSYICDMFSYTYHVECVSVLCRKTLIK